MNYNKKFNVGRAALAEPYFDYYHTLPLVTFGDIKNTIEFSLAFNSNIATENHFNIGNGFKFNLQKKLLINGTTIQLVDGNGVKVGCNHATNQTASNATVYALNDNSHRVLRKLPNGFELEYADFSKEIFDLSGKITNSYDKYGEEIIRFVYNTNGLLTSIIYRPSISETYKVLSFDYDSSSKVSSITYSASDTSLLVGNFVYDEDGIIVVEHYSGINYNCSISSMEYRVLAELRNGTEDDDKKILSCTKTQNSIMIVEHQNLNILNSVVYDSVSCTDDNEILIVDSTNFQGVTTRVHYKDHLPCYIYERMDSAEMFLEDGTAKSSVQIIEGTGINGVISPGTGYRLGYTEDHSIYGCDLSSQTTDYFGDAVFCGWIQTINERQCKFTIDGKDYYVNATSSHEGQFFAIRFYNSSSVISIANDSRLELKDAKLVFLGKDIQEVRTALSNSTTLESYDFKNIKFVNTTIHGDHLVDEQYEATFDDIVRYRANAKRNNRVNEFYYNNGRNLITNAEEINICYELRNSNGAIVKHYKSLNDFAELSRSVCYRDDSKTEFHSYADAQNFLTITREIGFTQRKQVSTYDSNMDLVSVREIMNSNVISYNRLLDAYIRNAHGLVTSQTVGEDITRQYAYDTNCTKLLSETDEFGTVTNYITNEVWGNITNATIGSLTSTESSYTDDGLDLTGCTFGIGDVTSQNVISYADGNVSSMETAGIEYSFEYTEGDLTCVKKNGIALKNIAYEDKYKTISVTTPTSSTSSYSKTAVTDKYGRELSISGCRTNTYALYPHFEENGEHTDYGGGASGDTLATTTDLTNNQTTYFGVDEDNHQFVVTKNSNSSNISSTRIVEDKSGRIKQKHFSCNATGSVVDDITYSTTENTWETDGRVSSHKYSIGNQLVANNTNTYDTLKRPVSKKNVINGIDFTKSISYNKSRVAGVVDEKDGTTTSNISYTYDALGRITSETDSVAGKTKAYMYDALGRLVRENNEVLNKTYTYQYDSAGNVTDRKTYAYTTDNLPASATTTDTMVYSTTYPDRLTSYNGNAVTYDQQGCPLTYEDKTFRWSSGKMTMIAYDVNSGIGARAIVVPGIIPSLITKRWDYTYNGNGQRTQKKYTYIPANNENVAQVATSEIVNYTYDHSGRLIHEQTGRTLNSGETSSSSIAYLYDCNMIIGMVHNGATYYFERNIQGDVVGVYDSTGTKVVTFKYDAFGRCTVSGNSTLAQWCKIRYRGYYFDAETELYWVQTRYYNPDWCRWISPDSISYLAPESPHGLNLYLYCGNDPVDLVDPTGNSWESFWNWVNKQWNKVTSWISNNIGAAILYGKEQIIDGAYYFVGQYETGAGYEKSFNNGKPINFFLHIPEQPWNIWEYSIGVDINIDGKGFAIDVGGKNALTIHNGNTSHEVYLTTMGRLGYKVTAKHDGGGYAYSKYQINGGEMVLVAVLAYYAAPILVSSTSAIIALINSLGSIGRPAIA